MKFRTNFVSNSSSASFIIDLNEYKNVFDLVEDILNQIIDYIEEEGINYAVTYRGILDRLLELIKEDINPNLNFYLPTEPFKTKVVRREDGYYVDTSRKYLIYFDTQAIIEDSEMSVLDSLDEKLYYYIPEFDVVGAFLDKKCEQETKIANPSLHVLLELEEGQEICTYCDRTILKSKQVQNNLEKYKDELPSDYSSEKYQKQRELFMEVLAEKDINLPDHEIDVFIELASLSSKFKLSREDWRSDNFLHMFGFNQEKKSIIKITANQLRLKQFPSTIFKLTNLRELALLYNNFPDIPEGFSKLKKLSKLWLSENKLTNLPEDIQDIPNLNELVLDHNKLNPLPTIIFKCKDLEKLDLRYNGIKELPKEISSLAKLKYLNLVNNKMFSFPHEIGDLKALKELTAWDNHLKSIPDSIGNLKNLKKLSLNVNMIQELPISIDCLQYLEELNLSNNQIQELPDSISNLKNLKELNLDENELKALPKNIGDLESLESLSLNNNDLISLPESLCEMKSLKWLKIKENPDLYSDEFTIKVLYALTKKGCNIWSDGPEEVEAEIERLHVLKILDEDITKWENHIKRGWRYLERRNPLISKTIAEVIIKKGKESDNAEMIKHGKGLLASSLSMSDNLDDLNEALGIFKALRKISDGYYPESDYLFLQKKLDQQGN